MGCASGAMTYAEDGSVAPGKGETSIEWNAEKPVEVGFYYYTENDAKILVKEFPLDKSCVEKLFTDENVLSSSGGVHWVKCVPGSRYAFKYTEGGHSLAFPNSVALELPKKIHAFHTKDDAAKDKLVGDLKKEADKDEGNAYKEENMDDKIKADIDSLGAMTSCSDFPKEMIVFKKACQTAEDLQPYNVINTSLDVWTEFGYWDDSGDGLKRELGLADKAKIKVKEEIEKKGPKAVHLALSTAQKGFEKVIEGAIEGASKKAGPSKDELAPNLAARLDNMSSVIPGVDLVDAREAAEGFVPLNTPPEGVEDPILEAAKAEYEADKSRLDALRAADKRSRADAENYLKAVYGSISNVDPAADNEKLVIANVDGFQVPAYVAGVDADGEHVTVNYAPNGFQDETSRKLPKQVDASKIEGSAVTATKLDAFTSLPERKDDFIERGRFVCIKDGRGFFQAYVKKVDGDKVLVEDQFKVLREVAKSDIYTHLTQQHVASRGVALTPNFAPMTFWWVAGIDQNISTRTLRIWRFGSDEAPVEVSLKAVTAKAKPTEENKNPTHTVHRGFSAEVELLLGAKYAYNFKIGDNYYVDYDKKGASDKCCKVITCNARVEY